MNTLNIYPKKLRKLIIKSITLTEVSPSPERYNKKILLASLISSIFFLGLFYIIKVALYYSIALFFATWIILIFRINLQASAKIRKMEDNFPDVISLMASNLKSGMTIDKSFLLSARKEFAPLDKEILKTGKDIATGNTVISALKSMNDRIGSEKISKVVMLIISGLKSGGNISDLLEETSSNMREKEFVEKRAASNVLMYVIFIFFAIGAGAPALFALSSVLVEVIINIASQLPPTTGTSQFSSIVSFNKIGITPQFIIYFAVFFLITTDLISSLIIGTINKGESKTGLKYFLPLLIFSLGLFFVIRWTLLKTLADLISLA